MTVKISSLCALIFAISIAGYAFVASLATAFGQESTLLSILMRAFLLSVSVLAICYSAKARLNTLTACILLPLIIYGVRLATETSFNGRELIHDPSHYWIWFIGVTVLPTLSVLFCREFDHAFALRALRTILIISAILIVLQGSTEVQTLGGGSYDTGRSALETLNPISVGHVGATLILVCIWAFFSGTERLTVQRLVLLPAIILGIYVLFISASRGPAVALGFALLCMGVTLNSKRRVIFIGGAMVMLIPFFYYLISIESQTGSSFVERFAVIGGSNDYSAAIRYATYAFALDDIASNPFLGHGIEVPQLRTYPHNLFIEFYLASGIFGGTMFVLMSFYISVKAFQLIRNGGIAGWAGAVFIHYFISAQFSGAVYSSATFWVSAALVVAASTHMREQAKPQLPPARGRQPSLGAV